MKACELLQSVQTVVDENEASVALNGVLRFVDNSISAALLKRSRSKLVPLNEAPFKAKNNEPTGQSRLSVVTTGCCLKIS